jgi:hypothetical protein
MKSSNLVMSVIRFMRVRSSLSLMVATLRAAGGRAGGRAGQVGAAWRQ